MGRVVLAGGPARAGAARDARGTTGSDRPALADLQKALRARAGGAGASAEEEASSCLAMFLCATIAKREVAITPLATPLFALGALYAAADHVKLQRPEREHLETDFLHVFCGTGRRQTAGWRRALHELERTRRGQSIRREGQAALNAWLRGESPDPYLRRALATP